MEKERKRAKRIGKGGERIDRERRETEKGWIGKEDIKKRRRREWRDTKGEVVRRIKDE